MIRIQNIYYMLAYAFQVLNEDSYQKVATEEFAYASDLFAAILAKGIASQIKRGLSREYVGKTEAISSPAGKINVSASVRQHSLLKKQLVCDYDEFIENAYMNKILQTLLKTRFGLSGKPLQSTYKPQISTKNYQPIIKIHQKRCLPQ